MSSSTAHLEGNPRLYLPHRLFSGHKQSFQAVDSPVALSGEWNLLPLFPFPPPVGLWPENSNAVGLQLHPLQDATHRTTSRAQTKTSVRIQKLQRSNKKLVNIRVCVTFWDNLVHYARHPGSEPNGSGRSYASTWTLPDNSRIASARQQVKGVRALASWYIHHLNRAPVIPEVNSEPRIQDEVLIQALEPMNGLLKTRYPPLNHYRNYPRWGRACNALHKNQGLPNNSGFPDFLLITSPPDSGAVGESKTPYVVPKDCVLGMWDDCATLTEEGTLVPNTRTTVAKLFVQIWGQLHFFCCHLGFFTNGELVMFFAKPNHNTLVLSDAQPWNHPEVHEALAGLSFAGVDILRSGKSCIVEQTLCPRGNCIIPNERTGLNIRGRRHTRRSAH